MIMETIKCTVCGKEKPLSEMSKSYPTRCKECVAEHTRLVRQRARNQQEEPLAPAEPHIDWEQRRYELATQAMVAMIDNKRISNAGYIAESAVELADCMIKEFKGGNK